MNTTQTAANDTAADLARKLEEERLALVRASHYTGAKYVSGRDLSEVAKDIRGEIAHCLKIGSLPAGLKCAVRISRYSMGQSVTVHVTAIPAGFVIANAARIRQDEMPGARFSRCTGLELLKSPEATELLGKLESLANAYNYDRSDSMVDYYSSNFHLTVDFGGTLEQESRDAIRAELGL